MKLLLICAFMSSATLALADTPGQPMNGNPLQGLSKLKNFEAARASSADPNWRNGNADARPIAVGETLTIADLKGPGVITHIWNTVAGEKEYSRLLVIRMYWDGETEPSVEAPLGDFFAVGHGRDAAFDSLPVNAASDGRARNCYWPMPFRESARITITNEGRERVGAFYYYVDWSKYPSIDPQEAYFHAQYRQEHPATSGTNYLIADIRGRGHYVGTVLNVRHRSPEWWGEGDDLFFIDGDTEPTLRGTGAEDYFCDAWGFRKHSGHYAGVTLWDGNEKPGAYTSVYRWHIPDPVPFKQSLRLEIEHKGVTFNEDGSIKTYFDERADDVSSVAYWYQVEPHRPFPEMPKGTERLYYVDADKLEGEALEGVEVTSGALEVQTLDRCSSGSQLFWKPEQADQVLTMTLQIGEEGEYDVMPLVTRSFDYGIYEFHLDGKLLGRRIDAYSPVTQPGEYTFAAVHLTPGTHTLTATNFGKNADSKGYYLGIDAIVLKRR